MKRHYNFIVQDSDDEKNDEEILTEPSKKRVKIDTSEDDETQFQVETPKEHHEFHPTLLSPFEAGKVTKVQEYPSKESEEECDISVKDYFKKFIDRTEEQCKEEREAPQRSLKWKEARKFCLTASDFGSAVGHNPYCSPDELLKRKLWNSFDGNDATKWGTFSEPKAGEAFLAWAKKTLDQNAVLHEHGLLKWNKTPYLAVSPDGVLEWKDAEGKVHYDLVEFKCPMRTSTEAHPYAKYENNTPPYYKDQMLGIWGLVNSNGGIDEHLLETVYFVVWQPTTLWITKYSFTMEQYNELFLQLKKWYFSKFLPSLVWYYNGYLDNEEVKPTSNAIDLRTFLVENKPLVHGSNSSSQKINESYTDSNPDPVRRSSRPSSPESKFEFE
jgi:putative phage-type endonuclease